MKNDISQQWKNSNEHIKKMSEQFNLEDIQKQIAERHINVEFRILSFMTQTEHHIEKLYKNPGQFPFNRYPNIMSFDHTRVIIGQQQNRDNPQNYINANIIQIDGKKVIACQGPLTNTFNNFWKMIEEQKVDNIFMLCSRMENTKIKCDLYWPTQQVPEVIHGQYQIKLVFEEENSGLYTRNFIITNSMNVKRNITQYQLTTWADGKPPTPLVRQKVNELLQKIINSLQSMQIPLVHCSAGIGRTGTFLAMVDLKLKLRQKKKISIFQCVRKLREQRWGMVYTFLQYEYLYQFVKQHLDISSDNSV